MSLESFEISALKGPRAEVIAQIQANAKVPDADRAYLIAQIEALPAKTQGVTVHAHWKRDDTNWLFDAHIQHLY